MRLIIRLAASCAIVTALAAPAFAAIDWNDAAIRWRPYSKALAEAKQNNRPICLVIYADWCRHCRSYGRVFHDAGVVEASRRFVMVRIDEDVATRLSKKFSIDGEYVPRTYFLSPNGEVLRIQPPRDDYKYFYDEDDPASLLAGMRAAARGKPR